MLRQRVYVAMAIITALATRKHGTTEQLAGDCEVSISYTEQVLAQLRRAGVVASRRGPGGGYQLAMPAAEVTAKAVADAIWTERSPHRSPFTDRVTKFLAGVTVASLTEGEAA